MARVLEDGLVLKEILAVVVATEEEEMVVVVYKSRGTLGVVITQLRHLSAKKMLA